MKAATYYRRPRWAVRARWSDAGAAAATTRGGAIFVATGRPPIRPGRWALAGKWPKRDAAMRILAPWREDSSLRAGGRPAAAAPARSVSSNTGGHGSVARSRRPTIGLRRWYGSAGSAPWHACQRPGITKEFPCKTVHTGLGPGRRQSSSSSRPVGRRGQNKVVDRLHRPRAAAWCVSRRGATQATMLVDRAHQTARALCRSRRASCATTSPATSATVWCVDQRTCWARSSASKHWA